MTAADPPDGDHRARARQADAPPLTLGTAGHIDHGKTALIALLTGKNTDRLREEQERGISIELGYAELDLPGGSRLSVIDVPGHERFVRAMVAGATGIDLFLLVIAADDGVMPQTAEHLSIIDLLGVRHGVVALTKADVVDEELLELAKDDVSEFLAESPYASSEIVTVSARDGCGRDELLAALERAATEVKARRRGGPARLPVDRVFPLKGIGTVVTGTLWQGEVRVGDPLVVEPSAVRTAVRSVQSHDHEAKSVRAGSRIGVNLRGLDRDEIGRGDWLVAPELAGHVARRFDAWVRVLPRSRPLRSGDSMRLHHGTAQFIARVAPLEGREIAPGTGAAAVVRLDRPAAVEPHDSFILRALSPVSTLGGGQVLAMASRRWHCRERHSACLTALTTGDAQRAVLELAADADLSGLAAGDLAALGIAPAEAGALLAKAKAAGKLEALRHHQNPARAPDGRSSKPRWFSPGTVGRLRTTLTAGAAERTAARPDRPFSGAGELAALVPGLPMVDVDTLLKDLAAEGELVAGEGGYAPADAGVLGDDQAALARELLARLRHEPLAPPTLAKLAEEMRRPPREIATVLDALARRGETIRVDKDLWFTDAAVAGARQGLEELLAADNEVSLAGFRDRMECGRRNAQALLELFDREGLTLRRGDVRVPRRRR